VIGRLRGVLVQKQPPLLLLDVNGVGYEVEAPMGTFYQLPSAGEEVTLHTHLVVREDAQLLYGFASEGERSLFRSLIKVNGVGAKLALTLLSGLSGDEFARSIQGRDVAALTRLPGVGKKTAERLIVEMGDRLEGLDGAGGALPGQPTGAAAAEDDPLRDAVSALVALGYKPAEATRMAGAVEHTGRSSEEIIREALKGAVKR